ncbi:MAG: UDP-3-O-(3-hydroxymyristoyl)glucosamine N-acyltransferase [Verrucomicrobiae bacterium]|nr:UDP-3-O-(3-hydroxymyristoyl)glucosamine N-acyltransferase [Verrucomicrobiae bacterium]
MKLTLQELAELVNGRLLRGDADQIFTGFAALKEARAGDVSFFGNEKYAKDLEASEAGAVFVRSADVTASESTALILVDNPVMAFDVVLRKFAVPKPTFQPGIHPSAVVADDVKINSDKVSIGAKAVIEAGAEIGDGTRIGAGAVIGVGAKVGRDCEIGPGVYVLYGCIVGDRVILHPGVVLGADGFGFEFVDGRHQKIEQLGIVRLEDDVEIGASTTVDRARFGETVIGEGTKIDNQVQVGHNVVIGKHCIVVAQSGISGSTHIGNYVVLGARTGVAGHLTIGDGAVTGGRSGVIADVKPGEKMFGYPAKPFKESMRTSMYVKRLGALYARVKKLEEAAGLEE